MMERQNIPGGRSAVVSGKFQYEAQTPSDFPAVGDYGMADWTQGENAYADDAQVN